jgi:hypothetical protein
MRFAANTKAARRSAMTAFVEKVFMTVEGGHVQGTGYFLKSKSCLSPFACPLLIIW